MKEEILSSIKMCFLNRVDVFFDHDILQKCGHSTTKYWLQKKRKKIAFIPNQEFFETIILKKTFILEFFE